MCVRLTKQIYGLAGFILFGISLSAMDTGKIDTCHLCPLDSVARVDAVKKCDSLEVLTEAMALPTVIRRIIIESALRTDDRLLGEYRLDTEALVRSVHYLMLLQKSDKDADRAAALFQEILFALSSIKTDLLVPSLSHENVFHLSIKRDVSDDLKRALIVLFSNTMSQAEKSVALCHPAEPFGKTPLHYAVSYGLSPRDLSYLIEQIPPEKRAAVLQKLDRKGRTAEALAIRSRRFIAARLLYGFARHPSGALARKAVRARSKSVPAGVLARNALRVCSTPMPARPVSACLLVHVADASLFSKNML